MGTSMRPTPPSHPFLRLQRHEDAGRPSEDDNHLDNRQEERRHAGPRGVRPGWRRADHVDPDRLDNHVNPVCHDAERTRTARRHDRLGHTGIVDIDPRHPSGEVHAGFMTVPDGQVEGLSSELCSQGVSHQDDTFSVEEVDQDPTVCGRIGEIRRIGYVVLFQRKNRIS